MGFRESVSIKKKDVQAVIKAMQVPSNIPGVRSLLFYDAIWQWERVAQDISTDGKACFVYKKVVRAVKKAELLRSSKSKQYSTRQSARI